jgi:multicomponent Na+:H+ antiporter subunit B
VWAVCYYIRDACFNPSVGEAILKNQPVLHVAAKLLIPYIFLYALYVQFHGEISPGGGFQAGVIFAAAIVLYSLVFGYSPATRTLTPRALRALAAVGVLIYGGTGLVTMLLGGVYLDYNVLSPGNHAQGQQWGIMAVELGVGITVFSVMLLLFFLFANREEER